MDLAAYIERQKEWSERTFGPGSRTAGLVKHIRKEIEEVNKDPDDIFEWIDIIILAIDGAWRAGYQPEDIESVIVSMEDVTGMDVVFSSSTQAAFHLACIENMTRIIGTGNSAYGRLWNWTSVVNHAIYGAWHMDWTAGEIWGALTAKQEKNLKREWPDWRSFSEDQAIEHVRSHTNVD